MIAISLIKMSLERPHFPTPQCFQLPKQAIDMSIFNRIIISTNFEVQFFLPKWATR